MVFIVEVEWDVSGMSSVDVLIADDFPDAAVRDRFADAECRRRASRFIEREESSGLSSVFIQSVLHAYRRAFWSAFATTSSIIGFYCCLDSDVSIIFKSV